MSEINNYSNHQHPPSLYSAQPDATYVALSKTVPINSSNRTTISPKTVLICYGNGAELGDLEIYSNHLKKNHLINSYEESNILIINTVDRDQFFSALNNPGLINIDEIHVFSHSAGAGLYLGYHLAKYSNERNALLTKNPNPTYAEVVNAEKGGLLTDHFFLYNNVKSQIISKFSKSFKFIKIWGCNSGIANWKYENSPYWGALNKKNTPKPSIAQAFADYFNVDVYGAKSGSHVEYYVNGSWKIYEQEPANYTDIRLHPDRGSFELFSPTLKSK